MQRKELKILLLQIRDDRKVRNEEHESFARYSRLEPEQISVHNVFDEPIFDPKILDGFDGLFIGGASEANVLKPEKYKFVSYSQELIKYAAEHNIPTFASCFGFQLAILAFGGQILSKERDYEMGSIPITLTNLASVDIVFRGIQNEFPALSIHRQYAIELPTNLDLLAYTKECLHSFKVRDKLIWAFQFHPEVDRSTVYERLEIYKEEYTDSEHHFNSVLSSLVETPESHQLLANFVDRVLLGR